MRSFQFLLFIFFIISFSFNNELVYSQKNEELVLHKIDDQNGLSDNNVQCIYKDKNNFVWIGTASGLNLMDGSDITIFKHEAGNPNSISDNNITALTGDGNKLLWIGTKNGVNSFNFRTRKFKFYPLSQSGNILNTVVNCMVADRENNIYIATMDGLFFFNSEIQKVNQLIVPGDEKTYSADNHITNVCSDSTGIIWITTFDGLWSYNRKIDQFIHQVSAHNDAKFSSPFSCSIVDHEGKIWIGTWDKGLKKFDPVTKIVSTFSIDKENNIYSIAEIKEPGGSYILWLNGDFRAFDPSTNKVIDLPVSPGFSKTPLINKLYTSPDNWLWIGTHQGLYFYNPAKSLFRQHRFTTPITAQVVSLLQWNQKVLVSGYGKNFLKVYDNNFKETEDYSKEVRDTDISCLSLKFSGSNTIKAGTSKGIADIDLKTHHVKFHHLDSLAKNRDAGNFITSLVEDKNHVWWLFPWRYGIWQTDSSCNHLHQVFNNFLLVNKRPKSLVIADAIEDKNGNLWFADLDEGIIFYNRKLNNFSKPFIKIIGEKSFASQIIYYQNRCFSFSGTEIYEWNPDNFQFKKISLPTPYDKSISSMAFDNTGNLWLATKKGLLVYDLKRKLFDRFTTADGLVTNEMDATLICMKNGQMIIGSPGYLSSFQPSLLLASIDKAPRVQLTEVVANGQAVEFDSTRKMTFGHNINNFIFKWTITDYNNPVNNHYYYQLKGIDKEWRPSGNHGEVEFANLSPGKYVLLLKGENANGVSAKKILSLDFTILTPFWRTWWFLSLLFLAIAGFFYYLYRYRLSQVLKIQKLRNKISLDLHDDIGSTLSSISILSEMALHENQPEETEDMLREIKENSISLMERMDDIVWSINPRNDSLESLFLRIKTFASKLFEAKEINYIIKIDEKIKHAQVRMEYRQQIYLIMKEAINNLVKYSNCTEAKLIVQQTNSHLSILIKDNGKGFEVQKAKYGNGLNSMRMRALDMHASLKITSQINEGASIFLSVKIK